MDYVFAGLWLVVGLLLIFRFGRENKVFYLLGAFFLILAGWWIADILLPVDLFAGVWPWVLRALALERVGVSADVCRDIDTPADVAWWEAFLGQ